MYCTHCGKEIPKNSKYCPQCGKKLTAAGSNSTWIYALGYIPVLFWLPLVIKPQTLLGRQVANQSLLLLIFGGGIGIVLRILHGILQINMLWGSLLWPIDFVVNLLTGVFNIGVFVLIIIGIVHGASGKLFRLPIIGRVQLISE